MIGDYKFMMYEGKKQNYIKQNDIQRKEGGSGYVDFVKNDNGDLFAIKKLKEENKNKIQRFKSEYNFQKTSKNRYIAKIYDESKNFDNNFFYVMPKYDCSFRDLMNDGSVTKKKMIKYILNICYALKYIEKKGIIHRDIKPENILYDQKNDIVVLSDFGIAHFPKDPITGNERLANFNYHAPEQKNNCKDCIGFYTDIYSLGLIINEIFTKNIPQGNNYKKIRDVYPEYFYLDDIVENMIQNDFKKRPQKIDNVIEEIKRKRKNVAELLYNINNFAKNEIYALNLEKPCLLIKQIKQDILYGYLFFSNEFTDYINANYHCNIFYSLDKEIINAIKLNSILNEIKVLINKESSEYNENKFQMQLNYEKKEDLQCYREFKELIDKLNIYKKDYEMKDKLLKYFSSLFNYHARRIIEKAMKIIKQDYDDYYDAPLFWILIHLKQEKLFEILNMNENNFFDYLVISSNKTNYVIEQNNFYNNDHKGKLRDDLKSKFNSIIITHDNNKNLLAFNKKDKIEFIKICNNYKISLNKYDVRIVDIESFINTEFRQNKYYYFELDDYGLYILVRDAMNFVKA